jgi:hypothetical protein
MDFSKGKMEQKMSENGRKMSENGRKMDEKWGARKKDVKNPCVKKKKKRSRIAVFFAYKPPPFYVFLCIK